VNVLKLIHAIQEALAKIDMINESEVDDLTLQEALVAGLALDQVSEQADKKLSVIKNRLRREASALPGTDTKRFEIDGGPEGHISCQVMPQAATIEVRKDADFMALKQIFGPRFPYFFEEMNGYKPRRNFRDLVTEASPADQAVLLGSVNLIPRTPQVRFERISTRPIDPLTHKG